MPLSHILNQRRDYVLFLLLAWSNYSWKGHWELRGHEWLIDIAYLKMEMECGSVGDPIVAMLDHIQTQIPLLTIVEVNTQYLHQAMINHISLTIKLWVKGSRKMKLKAQ